MTDFRQLEAFAAVLSVGSFTGAARVLGCSQPSVTRLVRELEEDLGLELFVRQGPKVSPTPGALKLHAEAEGLLTGLRQIHEHARQLTRAEEDHVRIVGTPALAAGLVPRAIKLLPDGMRPNHIHLRSHAAESIMEAALTRQIDVGVVSLPLEYRGIDVHWIGEAPCVALVAADSPFARLPTIDLDALADTPLLTLANPYRLRRRIDLAIAESGVERTQPILETNASLNAIQMAREGLGVAIVDPVSGMSTAVEGVVARPLSVSIPFFFGVITPYDHRLNTVARVLIGTLEDAARALVPGFVRHEIGAHDALLKRIYAADQD